MAAQVRLFIGGGATCRHVGIPRTTRILVKALSIDCHGIMHTMFLASF